MKSGGADMILKKLVSLSSLYFWGFQHDNKKFRRLKIFRVLFSLWLWGKLLQQSDFEDWLILKDIKLNISGDRKTYL